MKYDVSLCNTGNGISKGYSFLYNFISTPGINFSYATCGANQLPTSMMPIL